ncbi:BglG family transcription antiterminator [Streptococcus cameli]
MKDRSLHILNRLLISKFPIPIKRFETDLSISSRTIRNEILTINEFLREHEFLEIKSIRTQGVQLQLSDNEKDRLRNLLRLSDGHEFLSREERQLDLILSIAFGKEGIFLNKKEIEYDVSKSTMDEDMRQLRRLLKSYHIDIVSHPKDGLLFEGKESSIRIMLFKILGQEMVISHYRVEITKSKIISEHIPEKFLYQLESIFDKTISDREDNLYRMYFNLFTGIWLLRLSSGNFISEKTEDEVIHLTPSIDSYLNQVYEEFPIVIPKWEKSYIAFILKTLYTNENDNPTNWLELQMMIVQLIHYVSEKTGIPFAKKENQLQKGLYNHMVGMVARVSKGIQLSNPLTERIKHSYGTIYLAVKEFSKRLSQILENDIIDDEVAFLTIHFSTALSEINQSKQGSYRAVVICNQGMVTGKLLAENLKEYFNIEVLAVLNSREIDVVQKLDVDLVFSTIELEYYEKPFLVLESIIQEDTKERIQQFLKLHQDKQIIINHKHDYTSLFLDILKEFEKHHSLDKGVYEQIENLFHKNQLRINKREVQPMIQDILTDDKIVIWNQKETWRDAIKIAGNVLHQQDIIEESYIDAMIQSVENYGPYIVMAPGMALAHARPEDGAKQLGLSLVIFEEPVQFEDENEEKPVQVMFCLSAVDAFSHLNVMKSLVSLIRDTDKIEQLSQARDINTVKQILFHSKEEK